MVEHRLPKPRVAGSIPVARSKKIRATVFNCSLFLSLGWPNLV